MQIECATLDINFQDIVQQRIDLKYLIITEVYIDIHTCAKNAA